MKKKVSFDEYCNVYNLNKEELLKDDDLKKNLIFENNQYFKLVNEVGFEKDKIEQPKIRKKIINIKGEENVWFLLNNLVLMFVSLGSVISFFYFKNENQIKMVSIFVFILSSPVWLYSLSSSTESVGKWQIPILKFSKKYIFAISVINAIVVFLIAINQVSGIINSLSLKSIGIIIIVLLIVLLLKRN